MSSVPRLLTVCADDFGLSQAVSDAIVQLAQRQRITAISCMTNTAHWPEAAASLKNVPASVGVGMHLNLTEGRPLSPELARIWPRLPTLPTLLLRAHMGLLPQAALGCEIQAQWQAFVQETASQPAYVDGHQHVHQFPGIRKALFATFARLNVRPAVRSTAQLLAPGFAFKCWVIRHTGARQLKAALQHHMLTHNTSLLGAYDFKATDYRALMQVWLAALPSPGGLLFCHPGWAQSGDMADPIGAARQREFAYLASEDFPRDLAAADVRLASAWQ